MSLKAHLAKTDPIQAKIPEQKHFWYVEIILKYNICSGHTYDCNKKNEQGLRLNNQLHKLFLQLKQF